MGKTVFAVIMIVVLGLAGLGYYIYNDKDSSADTATLASSTPTHYVIATSTSSVTTTSLTPAVTQITATTHTTQVATAYQGLAGPNYHNGAYGLTVPGSYSVSQTANVFSDVPNASTLNFYQNGVLAFSINVWSREEWSKLRNEETWNADAGNTAGTYFGEGTYLGENETWIYSIVPGAYGIPSGIRFY